MSSDKHVHEGIGLGNVVAVIISWNANQDIFWCIIHGLLGWIYVIYYALGGGR